MAGEIKHSWTGTVLTITSDSGTSSCDLKGKQGDRGVRGAQGRAGAILYDDGSVDMTGYATEAYVEDLLENFEGGSAEVDLSNYYTRAEIDATIAELEMNGGGGSGGSSNSAKLTLQNKSDWLSKSIAEGASCSVSATWSSIEDGMSTGVGVLTISVDGVPKYSTSVQQGRFTVNIAPYLTLGNNSVRVTVTDVYENSRSIIYTVNVVSLSLTSTFDGSIPYEGKINYVFTPVGEVKKTVHFILDGKRIGSTSVVSSGRQQSYTIPAQSHGSHTFEVYYTVTMGTETIESNHLYYDLICVESGNNTPIISCAFNQKEIEQFETVNVSYIVYVPNSLTASIILRANNETVNVLTVDRTEQTWAYRADESGSLVLNIVCGDITKVITLNVKESDIEIEPTTENLELYLTSYGRSNNEYTPNRWIYEDISCTFNNYNWISDGWLMDDEGITVHRVNGDARLTIPLKMFAKDFRTTGKTIEFEFATRDVMDYDAEIISCMSGNIGFSMTAQKAILKSEQSEIYTQYKENEHIRLSFVVEKRAENRLIYIYLNGIMCGCTQYPDDDDFSQSSPVDITIGSNECTIDLYNIRVYNNDLTRYQVLDNWIADTQDIQLKLQRFNRNNVYDAYGNIVISKLPKDLPYMILEAPVLPQYKDNKLSVNGSYVNPVDSTKSFTFTDAEADVQGTSSAGYARKNYKLKFKNGLTQNKEQKEAYKMKEDSIPTNTFTFKADVASSEGANNVELVKLYDAISPYRTPPQLTNASVRQGIDGFPMVIFHNDGSKTAFIGKYNFNNDKGTPEVFGMDDNDESWEIRNNTSNRVIWKNADFSGTDWLNDFEARHPKDNTDATNLARFAEWVVSTDREQATGNSITPITYDGVEYTTDTADYRLAKFKAEIGNYAELQSSLFYYLFTELFLMVDSRAKNAFPTIYDDTGRVCWLPYDMDTAIGINNEGDLVFGYELEDIDKTDTGADVYNGQNSVFWCNIRDGYRDEIMAMYQELRSNNKISYDIVEKAFEEHQEKWCEAIWNEDAYYKYIEPLIDDGTGIYLPMLQGNKEEQRKWWLFNRFKYMDSKYNAGDAQKDFITLRGYAKSDIDITPYADIYATIKYGSYLVQERAFRGNSYTLACPLDKVNDTEIYIYSASQLKDIGDISGLKVGLADFSMATKLQNLKIGDSSSTYSNENLNSLTLGNNALLKSLDVRNCPKLGTGEQQSIDLSGCTGIESIYFEGTSIKGVKLPNGGILKTLHLPNTITNLTILNQSNLTDFVLNDYSNISTLRLENMDALIDSQDILLSMADGGRVRLIGFEWAFSDVTRANAIFNKIDTMRGLDENGNNVEKAQIRGKVNLYWECADYYEEWKTKYPYIDFEVVIPSLESANWTEIDELAASGNLSKYWNVGAEKTITLSTGEVITAVILGFNHDELYGSSTSKKASVSFGLKDCVETTSAATITSSGYGNSGLRNTIDAYFDLLPTDLQNVIKPVRKWYTYIGSSEGYSRYYSASCKCNLWAFAHKEIMGANKTSTSATMTSAGGVSGAPVDSQYEYFKLAEIPDGMTPMIDGETTGTYYNDNGTYYNTRAIKQLGNTSITDISYRTLSVESDSDLYNSGITYHTYYVRQDGSVTTTTSSYSFGVTFGFCI